MKHEDFLVPGSQHTIDLSKLNQSLCIQYESIKHKDKEYKTADILDGLVAAAQHYYRAGRNTPETPQNNENIPVREEMTVAQLRTLLKQGNADAQELVNDLVSELPNQITSWITKDIAQKYNGGDLTPEQFEDFWCYLRHEWELLDTCEELRSALEHWSTVCADE